MLQACLNGMRRRHEVAGVLETPEDTAAPALEVVAAGAEELHVHLRNANGMESLLDRDVSLTVQAIRRALPHIPLGVSPGAWIPPGGNSRIDAGVWSVSDAETLVDSVASERCLRELGEVPDLSESEALANAAIIWHAQRMLVGQ